MSATTKQSKVDFYLRTALAGGLCASGAHTVLVPIDVVKTRIQVRILPTPIRKINHFSGH